MTVKRLYFAVFAPLTVVSLSIQLAAVQPRNRLYSSAEDLLKGEASGVSVTSDGRLILSPDFVERFDTKEPFIHSAVLDRGGSLVVGTGSNGRIFRFTPGAEGKELAKLEGAGIYALAVDSANRIYAATAPEGKVYRIGTDGKPEVFFSAEDKYIWALAIDSDNNLYVGTGPKGIIYKVSPEGREETFFDSSETHIVTLEMDRDGNLLAGSSPEGLIFRISRSGKAFVLYDSPLKEIRSITVDRYGNVYAAALSGGLPAPEKKTNSPSKDDKSAATTESVVELAGTAKGGKLEVYRIDKQNLVQTLYSSDDQLAFDLLVRPDGNLLVATGDKGRILSIDPRRYTTLLVECKEEQVIQMLEGQGNFFAVTSNLGKIYELKPEVAASGEYEADVLDAGVSAKWGVIRWTIIDPTPGAVKVFTRTGNTSRPDETWSSWEGPYTEPSGSAVGSPPARFIQWKAEFMPTARTAAIGSQTNALEQVEISYVQQNLPPEFKSVTVNSANVALLVPPLVNQSGGVPPGGPGGAHSSTIPKAIRDLDTPQISPPPRKVFVPGARSFGWSVTDPNEDDLVFSLYLRREGDDRWQPAAKDLTDSFYTIDGASYPDGNYSLRVVASDRPSNPPDQAQESSLLTKPFIIVNSIPLIQWGTPKTEGAEVTLSFNAKVSAGAIYQAEYSVDGGDWSIVFPEDGIADSREEKYSLRLTGLTAGGHTVLVRVADVTGNLGSAVHNLTAP